MSVTQTLPPPSRNTARLLIVDHDDARALQTASILRDESLEVEVRTFSHGLVERMRVDPPDVLLLRVPLEEGDCLDLCREVRSLEPAPLTAIVLMSESATDEAAVVRGLGCGADDFITGPERAAELKARVRVQLRHRRDRELLQWASAQRARFRSEALVDALTGIGNRRAAEEGLERVLQTRESLLLLMVDADHFKQVNDTHGHAVGDLVLKDLAACMDRLARRGDVVARYGGEEFLVLLRGANPAMGERIAHRFRRTIADLTFDDAPQVGTITASIGMVTWSGGGEVPAASDLLQAADDALYRAKRGGRNCVCVTHMDRSDGAFAVA